MPRVSMIMATYNNAPYLAEAIESALSQSVPPDEIIVVDDGSTDETERVVHPFVGARVRYLKQTNQGVSAARNAGMAIATGDYLTFLDGDDRLRPTMIESQLRLMESEPQLVCCFGNFVRFLDSTNESLGDQFQYFRELRTTPSTAMGDATSRLLDGSAFPAIITWSDFPAFMLTMLFRRTLIQGVDFDRRLVRCQDAGFVLRVCMRGRIAYTDQVLAEVRRHGRNATSDVGMMPLDKLRALECASEDPRVEPWRQAMRDRLVRARFDAANALLGRRQWSEAGKQVAGALQTPGSNIRKARGILRTGLNFVAAFTR